jgi:hypothetical protein
LKISSKKNKNGHNISLYRINLDSLTMTIIASIEANKLRLENSIDRILSNCSPDLRAEIENMKLIITDDVKATEVYNDEYDLFKKTYRQGFGGIKGNINYQGANAHLVVLNITNIDAFGLSENEFDGVFSHELGHIFNENPIREVPSIVKGNTKTEIDEARKIVLKEMELYADYFSKLTLTSDGLVGSMEKYIASDDCINRELFVERIQILKTNTILSGTTKAFR